MVSSTEIPPQVLQFVAEKIDTVPQIEALLLLWENPAQSWSAAQIASRVYVEQDVAKLILEALRRRQLITTEGDPPLYRYSRDWDTSGDLMHQVATEYRRHLVQLATFIHSGASSSVREFARAFDFKKER